MKKLIQFSSLLAILSISFGPLGAAAQSLEFRITPNNAGPGSMDQEARIRRLEYAVQELQMKVFNLQVGAGVPAANSPAFARKYFCEVKAFMKTYQAFGPTQLEAKQKAVSECREDNNEMHCKNANCRENQ